jgi:hypothetical protein
MRSINNHNYQLSKLISLSQVHHLERLALQCLGNFLFVLAYNLQNPPVNWKQGQVAEEMSQTLLTNKKQRKMTNYAANIIKRT